MAKYVCDLCGWEYDPEAGYPDGGIAPGTPWEDVPADFVCPLCGAHFELSQMEADHITPWRDGGRTVPENCQMLCADCNRRKSDM